VLTHVVSPTSQNASGSLELLLSAGPLELLSVPDEDSVVGGDVSVVTSPLLLLPDGSSVVLGDVLESSLTVDVGASVLELPSALAFVALVVGFVVGFVSPVGSVDVPVADSESEALAVL
jgi:hypothetical protein